MTMLERAEAAEHAMSQELDRVVVKSVIFTSGERDPRVPCPVRAPDQGQALSDGGRPAPGEDAGQADALRLLPLPLRPRQPHAPERAARPEKNGLEREDRARLPDPRHRHRRLHPRRTTATGAAQLVEPYVDPEVAGPSGITRPCASSRTRRPATSIPGCTSSSSARTTSPSLTSRKRTGIARGHKWYMTSRLVTVNDLYAFDPAVRVELEEFTDVVARNFRQPKEGLGFDQSPSAHMWRTINAPTRYL